MKHLMKLLFVPFLLFFSCTTQVDGVLNDGDLPQNNEDASVEATLHPVGISFSKSSIAAFAEEGISEIGIYVYMDGSLIYLSLIHISEPTRQAEISYAVFCLKKKKKKQSHIHISEPTRKGK